MVLHSTLTGADLHKPLGHSVAGTLVLAANTAGAYYMTDAADIRILQIDTTTGANQLIWGPLMPHFFDATSDPTALSGKAALYSKTSSGTTHLFSRDSGGTVHQLTPVGVNFSSTNALSITVNADASAAVDEDPSYILLGGDGVAAPNNDIIRSTWKQDSTAEEVAFTMERSRNGGAYGRVSPTLQIGFEGETTTTVQAATLQFECSSAGGVNKNASITLTGVGKLTLSQSAEVAISSALFTISAATHVENGSLNFPTLSTPGSNVSRVQVYGQTTSGVIELFAKLSDANVIQITKTGTGFVYADATTKDVTTNDRANGQKVTLGSVTELLSGLSGATVATTIQIPATSILKFVSVYVTTLITGATSFDVGPTGGTANLYGDDIAVAATTANKSAQNTVNASAVTITLTANGSNFTAGAVRVTAHYETCTAPTS